MTDENGNPVSNLTAYEMRHRVAHLAAAGRTRDLHSLLSMNSGKARNAWHAAKYEMGDVSGSLNERLAERALALAKEIEVDDYIRVVFMLDLLARLPLPPREGFLAEIASATLRVTDLLVFEAHLDDLLQVGSRLPEKSLRDLASKAFELKINKETIVKTLLEQAAHLPQHARVDARRAALKEIENIENPYTRLKLLERSTMHSPSDRAEMIKDALDFVFAEKNNEKQNSELVAIIKEIPRLPRKDMLQALHHVLRFAVASGRYSLL